MFKKVVREILIHSAIMIMIIPATVVAVCITIKNMMLEFPDDIYQYLNEEL